MNGSTIMTASREWAKRPADERFTSLLELGGMLGYQRACSGEKIVSSKKLSAAPVNNNMTDLALVGPNGNPVQFSHWSFGQVSNLAGAPASYLRTLPAPVAADCLNYGLQVNRNVEDVGVLLHKADSGKVTLRAATGPKYGRVWNNEIVDAMIDHFGDGVNGHFRVPGEFGQRVPITRDNTTIYCGDRDMFVFLTDEDRRIDISNRRDGKPGSLARGFYVWNSEVGSQTCGIAMFLFDYVCMNRIIWGAQDFKEIKFRHTVSAPDKWLQQVAPILNTYANSSPTGVEETIKLAQAKRIETDLNEFMRNRFGLTNSQAKQIAYTHELEENKPIETMWDLTTGITAFAKTIEYQDERVAMERIGGKVLELVAA